MMTNDIFETKIVFTISTNNNFQKIGPFKSMQSELKFPKLNILHSNIKSTLSLSLSHKPVLTIQFNMFRIFN